ncbi:hypothetical protein M419DRAFT_37775 [Trichoderma reesei RUT C-30]|uniref:Uncharacterized protein n=1 Tax=Hypocrea jecorina (strain ATCC 56765 / BCRC 32924 / NRRL 11460 / Rut C-30) TaxID=1344414 RepID=A0A024S2M5_HYPJR|nr:hypothetical protein M419DRAFT_37775 [Trichoderma reesei RUT C-30]
MDEAGGDHVQLQYACWNVKADGCLFSAFDCTMDHPASSQSSHPTAASPSQTSVSSHAFKARARAETKAFYRMDQELAGPSRAITQPGQLFYRVSHRMRENQGGEEGWNSRLGAKSSVRVRVLPNEAPSDGLAWLVWPVWPSSVPSVSLVWFRRTCTGCLVVAAAGSHSQDNPSGCSVKWAAWDG